MEIQISNNSNENNSKSEDFITALELSYINNHYLDSIEKKYNKLINTEIEPCIDVILIQYYLVILGGDYINQGLVDEMQNYINKLDSNITQYEQIKSNLENDKKLCNRSKNIYKIMDVNKKKVSKLYSTILKTYKHHLSLSTTEIYSVQYELHYLHQLQKITFNIIKSNAVYKEHLKNLNIYIDKLNEKSETFDDENNIYKKFLDSQISVIEQQIEMFK